MTVVLVCFALICYIGDASIAFSWFQFISRVVGCLVMVANHMLQPLSMLPRYATPDNLSIFNCLVHRQPSVMLLVRQLRTGCLRSCAGKLWICTVISVMLSFSSYQVLWKRMCSGVKQCSFTSCNVM